MNFEASGSQFLHQKDSKLHTTSKVEHEKKRKKENKEIVSDKPTSKIEDFLNVIEKTHLSHQDDPRVLERLKDYYYKENVIKGEDVPESYYKTQQRLAREQGHGDIEINNETKEQLNEVIISDQKSTLDNWLDYFTSQYSDSFPVWAKYWAFNGMLKLSFYDKEKHVFNKRNKETVAPFPDLNREALAFVVDSIVKRVNKESIPLEQDNEEFKKLLQGASFGKLYAFAIEKVIPTEEKELANIKGEWIKYNMDSDHMSLVNSLQGYATGWCIAGESTAKHYIRQGDFYIYYSFDKQGNPTIPRAAIRMQGSSIGEVRGIASEQNLDPYIGDVVDEKLQDFFDGKEYKKKSADMKQLTKIDNRVKQGGELTKNDFKFLYEIDSKIQCFGHNHNKDPRIEEILQDRDWKKDLSFVTGYKSEQISNNRQDVLNGKDIKYFHGDLDFRSLISADNLKLPDYIGGDLDFISLTSAENLKLPDHMGGDLNLNDLTSADNLKLPDYIGGDLDLYNLTSADNLKLPDYIGGNLDLGGLTSAENLKLPDYIGGNLNLDSLTSSENLKLPNSIDYSLSLSGLTSAENLKLPDHMGGGLYLYNLTSAENLKLPDHMGGYLCLDSLISADNLKLPDFIGGYLSLRSLTLADNLKLPDHIGGDFNLGGLTSVDNLKLPDHIGGNLDLNGLTSVDNLKLPDHIGGGLILRSLTSADNLKLPDHIGGGIYLDSLTSADRQKLREKYPQYKDKI